MTCKVLRIGVFFDGTGNNKENDRAGRSENGMSNIAYLSDLYYHNRQLKPKDRYEFQVPQGVCEVNTRMVYIEGVGTVTGGENYSSGLAGGEGGAERVDNAIKKVFNYLGELKGEGSDPEFKNIIDVFGFSRGAALARDFINTLIYRHQKDFKFKFGFVGLYDTVGSFGLAGNDVNWKPLKPNEDGEMDVEVLSNELGVYRDAWLDDKFEAYNFNLSMPMQEIDSLVHLTALHEFRENFPLTNIQGSGGEEHGLLGVHSDVGGGYPKNTVEPHSFRFPEVPKRVKAEGRFFSKVPESFQAEIKAMAESKQSELNAHGNKWVCTPITQVNTSIPKAHGSWADGWVVCKEERNVTDDLQKVGLEVMYRKGLYAGVPFMKRPGVSELAKVPDELEDYRMTAITKLFQVANYPDAPMVLAKYAHHSAVDTEEALTKKDSKDFKDLLANKMDYDDAGAPDRTEFSNRTGKCVAKKKSYG